MLYIVGLGPGSKDLMTQEALDVIEKKQTPSSGTSPMSTWLKTC